MVDDEQAVFERVLASLRIPPEGEEYGFAYACWSGLIAIAPKSEGAGSARLSIEESLVWRLILSRMLRELGEAHIFSSRDSGAAKGTYTVHPGIEALAKTYERLRRSMSELTDQVREKTAERPLGLPDRMKPLLEEAEVVFDELLGPGRFPGRAPKNGMDRQSNSGN